MAHGHSTYLFYHNLPIFAGSVGLLEPLNMGCGASVTAW